MNIVYLWVSIILSDNQLPFLFSRTINKHRKNEVSKMIESKNDASRNLEKALQAYSPCRQSMTVSARRSQKLSQS